MELTYSALVWLALVAGIIAIISLLGAFVLQKALKWIATVEIGYKAAYKIEFLSLGIYVLLMIPFKLFAAKEIVSVAALLLPAVQAWRINSTLRISTTKAAQVSLFVVFVLLLSLIPIVAILPKE